METLVHIRPVGYTKKWQLWEAKLDDGEVIVARHHDPGFAACRVLNERGITGKMTTVHLNGTRSMTIDIGVGAGLCTIETAGSSAHVGKYREFDRGVMLEPETDSDEP